MRTVTTEIRSMDTAKRTMAITRGPSHSAKALMDTLMEAPEINPRDTASTGGLTRKVLKLRITTQPALVLDKDIAIKRLHMNTAAVTGRYKTSKRFPSSASRYERSWT